MDENRIRKHAAACLYGGAMGDALGYPVEFDDWDAIRAKYGKDGIRDLVLIDGKARVSDDTQMTLFTAEGLFFGFFRAMERGVSAPAEYYVYQSYLCWLQTQGYPAKSLWDPVSLLKKDPDMNHRRAPGNTCLTALRSEKMGTIGLPLNHSKGCGGVMRTAPLGFLRTGWNNQNPFGKPLLLGACCAAITHGHPMGWIPAGMLSDIVDRCLFKSYRSLKKLILDSLSAVLTTFSTPEYHINPKMLLDYQSLILRAVKLAEGANQLVPSAEADEANIRSLGQGWVGDEALAIAIYAALRYQKHFRSALVTAVNHSGDSDSTGAITGNILGAWGGMEAVPEDWLHQLELTDHIEAIADMVKNAIHYD